MRILLCSRSARGSRTILEVGQSCGLTPRSRLGSVFEPDSGTFYSYPFTPLLYLSIYPIHSLRMYNFLLEFYAHDISVLVRT